MDKIQTMQYSRGNNVVCHIPRIVWKRHLLGDRSIFWNSYRGVHSPSERGYFLVLVCTFALEWTILSFISCFLSIFHHQWPLGRIYRWRNPPLSTYCLTTSRKIQSETTHLVMPSHGEKPQSTFSLSPFLFHYGKLMFLVSFYRYRQSSCIQSRVGQSQPFLESLEVEIVVWVGQPPPLLRSRVVAKGAQAQKTSSIRIEIRGTITIQAQPQEILLECENIPSPCLIIMYYYNQLIVFLITEKGFKTTSTKMWRHFLGRDNLGFQVDIDISQVHQGTILSP